MPHSRLSQLVGGEKRSAVAGVDAHRSVKPSRDKQMIRPPIHIETDRHRSWRTRRNEHFASSRAQIAAVDGAAEHVPDEESRPAADGDPLRAESVRERNQLGEARLSPSIVTGGHILWQACR
jgi:hypothetical protein